MRLPLSGRRSRLRFGVALLLVLVLAGLQARVSALLPTVATASAAELSAPSYIETRDLVLGTLPEDPILAARVLVDQILGPSDDIAQVATIELLRQAGIPTIDIDAHIVAMPSDGIISNGPMIGEYLARLTRSVRNDYFYTIADVADIFLDSEATTEPIPPDMLLGGIAGWGKFPDAPRESVIAGTAVRELGARRGEPLFSGLDPLDTRVDLLQFTLLYLHLTGVSSQVDVAAQAPSRNARHMFAPAVARAEEDCRSLYDALQLKPYAGKDGVTTATNAAFKEAFFTYLESKNAAATSQVKSALRYVDIASKAANLIVFLTSIELNIEVDKVKTHFRHSGGDTSRDVSAVATASWNQGETAQQLRCLQGLAGIETHANGPLPGFLVKWRLDEALTSAKTAKLLRAKAGHAKHFGPGDTTDSAGQSRVVLEPPVERQPGAGALMNGNVTIYASLDKESMPDALKAFLGNKTFITDYLRDKATAWPRFVFDQIYDISLKAIQRAGMPVKKVSVNVEYHGSDAFAIQGVRHPFLFYYSTMIDVNVYTCEGLNGRWHGSVDFEADKSVWSYVTELVIDGNLPNKSKYSAVVDSFLDLRGGKSDELILSDPFRLTVTADQSLIDRGYYGTVGDATVTLGGQSMAQFMFFDPAADLPLIRLNKQNQPDLDELCPNSESYFP